MTRIPLAFALAACTSLASAPALAQQQPRYMAQIQAELQAMNLAPQCTSTTPAIATCTVRAQPPGPDGRTPNPTARRFVITVLYSDDSDTVYAYIERYAMLRADAANAGQVTRRLLEINWETLVAKLELAPLTGEIRMSTTLSTDSNFDRRAFRSAIRSLVRVADRYAGELSQLTQSPIGETPTTAPSAPAAR
ncbi:MAG: hypothetical protein Q8Q09_29480 [Deltaproteobacteria bacterium]|nr:hypothetical protein [Deltaproteobacteria bacterium]